MSMKVSCDKETDDMFDKECVTRNLVMCRHVTSHVTVPCDKETSHVVQHILT